MNIVIMIIAGVLVFGLVIFVHELGHFTTAKLAGIKVNEFAIGMGPKLLSFGKGETRYSLRAFPIGGFVSMEGEDEASSDVRGFQQASIPRRLLVMVAGAFMNMVLGFVALLLVIGIAYGEALPSRTVAQFNEGAVIEKSGLQEGDTIIAANGHHCFSMSDVLYELERTRDGNIDLTVLRDGEKVKLTGVEINPEMALDFKFRGVEKTFGSIVKEAGLMTLSYGKIIYRSLLDLVTGQVPLNSLSGPVGIVNEIGKAAQAGWINVVNLMAIISINLGIVNMLPLPALDGGKVVLLLVEAVIRRPLNKNIEIGINLAGFALLIGLMIFVSFNDIKNIFF